MMQAKVWQKEWIETEKIAILRLDIGPDRKQNTLTRQALKELNDLIDYFLANEPTALVIASAKEDSFCAGADIDEIQKFLGNPDAASSLLEQAHGLLLKIRNAPFPIVAAISGECLGGGLELALACHARIAAKSPGTRLGLPETRLGLIPGFGGTQLLPRLIGLENALKIIVGQKTLSAKDAYAWGLVDKIVAQGELVNAAIEFAHSRRDELLTRRMRRTRRGFERIPFAGPRLIESAARKRVFQETHGVYPALNDAIDAVMESYHDLSSGLAKERSLFVKCLKTSEAQNLINIFFLRKDARSRVWVRSQDTTRPPERVGVLGAGVMGRGIAYSLIASGIPTVLHDLYAETVHDAVVYIEGLLGKEVAKGRLTIEDASYTRGLLTLSWGESLRRFSETDFIIEAVTEDLNLKKKVFGQLAPHLKPDTVVATNTSSLLPSAMAVALPKPENFLAMHFFNPAPVMELVEIAGYKGTSEYALAKTVQLTKALGKTPIVLEQECPGLLVNRVFPYYIAEAMKRAKTGAVHPAVLDETFERFGMVMGPFKTLDLVGFDVAEKVFLSMQTSYPGRFADLAQFGALGKDKRVLGQKSGRGFYVWEKSTPKRFNDEILAQFGFKTPPSDRAEARRLAERAREEILALMIRETDDILSEGICSSPDIIDLALIFGAGFAPNHRGITKLRETKYYP